jgi:ATP-dependent exoDNAse (exonuclease V) alpha subunit
MIAHRRADVADLNERARERLCADGKLQGPEIRLPGGTFAVGDRVVVKRNDLARGVHNGDRGQIVAADAAGSLVVLCGDRRAVLDRRFLMGATADGEPTLLHGYAITGHVAQGLTVDRTFVLATEGMTQEWAYVAMSRGRHSNRLYVAARGDGLRAEFAPTDCHVEGPVAAARYKPPDIERAAARDRQWPAGGSRGRARPARRAA